LKKFNFEMEKHYDEHSLYIDSGVATEAQVSKCLKEAIEKGEEILGSKNTCKFKVNLIVNKDGEYFGFGYIRVSDPKIYWMLLGRNPDGSERIEEYPDPNWSPPKREILTPDQIIEKSKRKTWIEQVEEEDAFIQPMIKKQLPPLIAIPGYKYDVEQRKHLKELAEENGTNVEVPLLGHFEISRGYATDTQLGMLKNRICARNVPDWIPIEAFKSIFSFYVSDKNKKIKEANGNEETYPIVNFVDSNKGRIVFVTFDPQTKDAIFALLMTKKLRIAHPKDSKKKTTLVFMHAYDNSKKKN
jgi:hypothetical protein